MQHHLFKGMAYNGGSIRISIPQEDVVTPDEAMERIGKQDTRITVLQKEVDRQ